MTTPVRGKILLIDGMNAARRHAAHHLAEHGFQVLEARDGSTGRDMAVVNLPDLIVTELRLDGLDGLALIRSLRAVPALAATPIVVLTVVGDDASAIAALEAGASDYIAKPVVLDVLRARVVAQVRTKLLHDEAQHRKREVELLFETLKEVTESATLEEILFRITQRLGRMMAASRCSIIAINERRRVGTIAASMEDPRARGIELDLARYPEIVEAVRSLQAVLIDDRRRPDLREELSEVFRVKNVASILTVPVIFRQKLLGVLTLHVREGEPRLTEDNVRLITTVAFAIGGLVHTTHRLEALSVVAAGPAPRRVAA